MSKDNELNKGKQENPLEKLIIERKYEIEELLYDMLKDLVRFERETKNIVFLKPFYKCLDSDAKVIVALAAVYALYKLGWRETPDVNSKEIAQITGLNYNTVRPRLSKAGKAYKYAEKVESGVYRISLSKLYDAKEYIINILNECKEVSLNE